MRKITSHLLIVCLVWLVVLTIYMLSADSVQQNSINNLYSNDMQLADIHYTNSAVIWEKIASQDRRLTNAQYEIDVLKGKVNVLDEATLGRDKRKARMIQAIKIIKGTLPLGGNFLPGCPKAPSPGELWSIAGAIIDNADEYAVPASLIAGVIRQESAFCNLAVSHAGARGYMQLMPETAAEVAADVAVKTRRTLRTWRGVDNIQMGTAYLSQMILEFDGNIELAVKAYNAGPIHIKRVEAGERALYAETENYVEKVLEYQKEYERLGLQ